MKILKIFGIIILLVLALVGWYVLLVQHPLEVALARARYNNVVAQGLDLSKGPCLGTIKKDWILDIAHLPRQPIDDLPENQCHNFQHFVEMSPQGEIIVVQ